MMRFRYVFLLGALVLLVCMIGIVSTAGRHPAAQYAVNAMFLALLVIGALASSTGNLARWSILVAAGLTAVIRIVLVYDTNPALEVAAFSLAVFALFSVAGLTIRHLLASSQATYDTLAASLCAYGFLVAAWAAAYSLLEILQPGAFNYAGPEVLHREMRFGLGESATALYFSLVTITTLGYGDIVPATDAARLLAATEAFLGQAYIAILVAKLVGQYVASATTGASPNEQ